MATKKKFTPEEIKNLKANPYTLRVTEDTISYTLAFKEAFWVWRDKIFEKFGQDI